MTLELVVAVALGTMFLLVVLALVEGATGWRDALSRRARRPGAAPPVAPVDEHPPFPRLDGRRPFDPSAGPSSSPSLGPRARRILAESTGAWLIRGLADRLRAVSRAVSGTRHAPPDASAPPQHDRGPTPASPPIPVRPSRIVVSGDLVRSRQSRQASRESFAVAADARRLRLGRDAVAVLAVGAAAALVVSFVGSAPRGGVLSASGTPAGLDDRPAVVTAAPPATAAEDATAASPASPGRLGSQPAGSATAATSRPTPRASRRPTPSPAVTPSTRATQRPAASGGATSGAGAPGADTPAAGAPGAGTPAAGAPGAGSPYAATPAAGTAPTARFDVTSVVGPAPLSVEFHDRSSGSITTWAWDFGDGATSGAANPSHTFTSSGVYGVTLTVGGPGGADSATMRVTVEPAPSPSPS
ncbi:MAG TPA: PKD domain-containing protein [Candidatus Limnocylindrales bacterium]